MSMFTGTAEYYDKYRPSIPGELVVKLVAAAGRDTLAHSLLDLGAGTGKVTEQFLPYFKDIVVVEPEEELMALAKKRLVPAMPADASIFFLDGSAELVQYPPNWSASLVTICRAFHWMDQATVLQRLDEVVESRGVVAVFSDKSFWTQNNLWMIEVRKIVQSYLGEVRRAGAQDIYTEPESSFEEMLKASPFSDLETIKVPVRRIWSPDQIIGYLYSTSFAAKGLFGDHIDEFEMALRDKLHRMMPNGKFIEENVFEVILARRP